MKTNKRLFHLLFVIGLTFTGCSNENDIDITPPKVNIQSPILYLNYSTEIGNSNVSYSVILQAQGADETKMATLKLIVTDRHGTIVLEKTRLSDADTRTVLDISEGFETTNAGIYNAIFIATDTSGNVTSESRNFTYED